MLIMVLRFVIKNTVFRPHFQRFGIHLDSWHRITKKPCSSLSYRVLKKLRRLDLNQRPLGYEPNELPDCSTPRFEKFSR